MKYALLFIGLCATTAQAQNVGINATGAAPAASAMLDIVSTSSGLLIPRVALTATNAVGPVAAPANALLVYNTATAGAAPNNVTPGFYSWDTATARWIRFASDGDGWKTTGNAGTSPTTNFIGTTDAQDWVIKTGSSAAANERARFLAAGKVVVNNVGVGANVNDVFSVYANATTNGTTANTSAMGTRAIMGYTSSGMGVGGVTTGNVGTTFGLYGAATSATGPTVSIRGDATSPNGLGVLGMSNIAGGAIATGSGIGVQGQVNGTLSGTARAIAVLGITPTAMNTGDATGVQGQSGSSLGTGVLGLATSTVSTAGVEPVGTYGQASSSRGFGLQGVNTSTTGTGSLVTGNNVLGSYLVNGSGSASTGLTTGSYSFYTAPGVGQGILIQDVTASQWNVGYWSGLAYFKIIGPGTVSTIVKDTEERPVAMYCPEAPEVLFQDYGIGRLQNGQAVIALDPTLMKNILVDETHPLKVFIQLEGDCNGVYVTDKSAAGFTVRELGGGTSDVAFAWSIVATRGDEVHTGPDGTVRNASYRERFGAAPTVEEHHTVTRRSVKAVE